MSLFNLEHKDALGSKDDAVASAALINELDQLVAKISAWAEKQHNPDGTHKFGSTGSNTIPVGGMIQWPTGVTVPTGWLVADGSAVSRTTYALLFTAIGISAGAGNGTTTFNVPTVANFIILTGN